MYYPYEGILILEGERKKFGDIYKQFSHPSFLLEHGPFYCGFPINELPSDLNRLEQHIHIQWVKYIFPLGPKSFLWFNLYYYMSSLGVTRIFMRMIAKVVEYLFPL